MPVPLRGSENNSQTLVTLWHSGCIAAQIKKDAYPGIEKDGTPLSFLSINLKNDSQLPYVQQSFKAINLDMLGFFVKEKINTIIWLAKLIE